MQARLSTLYTKLTKLSAAREPGPARRSGLALGLLLCLFSCNAAWAGFRIEGLLSREKTVQPGVSYGDDILIVNNDATAPAEIKLYQADYSFSADGSNQFARLGSLPRSNGPWLKLSQEHIVVPASGSVSVHYEVQVPDDATLKGSFWSMVMIEAVSAEESSLATKKIGARAAQSIRYGMQIVTDIGDTGLHALVFQNPQLISRREGARLFTVDVANTGERFFRPQLSLELHGVDGQFAQKFDAPSKRIYPGTSVRYEIDVSEVPAGKYLALIGADAGGDDLYGSQLELTMH